MFAKEQHLLWFASETEVFHCRPEASWQEEGEVTGCSLPLDGILHVLLQVRS